MRGPVTFHHLRYTPADFSGIDEDDVIYFFMTAQIHNDVSALLRLLLAHMPPDMEVGPQRVDRSIMTFMLVRLLAGRLEEAWKTIKDRFAGVFVTYEQDIDHETMEAYGQIRQYFSAENPIRLVRDKAAFHFDRETFRKGWRQIEGDTELVEYMAWARTNTVYGGAEEVLMHSVAGLLKGERDDRSDIDVMREFVQDASTTAFKFLDVVAAYMQAFLSRHHLERLERMKDSQETVEDQPDQEAIEPIGFVFSPTDQKILGEKRRTRRRLMGSAAEPAVASAMLVGDVV